MPHWPGHSGWSRLDMWLKLSQTESFPGSFTVDFGEKTPLEVVSTGASSGPSEACGGPVPREWDFSGLGTLFLLWKWRSPTLSHKIVHQSITHARWFLSSFPVNSGFTSSCVCMHAQLCPTVCDPMDCRTPGSSVYGMLQARILEWVAIPFSRGSSWPRDSTRVSWIAGGFFATEPPWKPCFTLRLS